MLSKTTLYRYLGAIKLIQPYDTYCVDPEKKIYFHSRVTKFGVRMLSVQNCETDTGFKYIQYQTFVNGIPQLREEVNFTIEGAEIMKNLLELALKGQ